MKETNFAVKSLPHNQDFDTFANIGKQTLFEESGYSTPSRNQLAR